MNKQLENKIRKIHPYKITEPASDKGRWSTYYMGEYGRKKLQKTKKEDLMNFLFEIYKEQLDDTPTLEIFFNEWLKYKKLYTRSNETLRRHIQHYHKYFKNSSISKIPLGQLTKFNIEEYIHETIRKHNLTTKELSNMLIILKGSLELAYDRDIITANPYSKVKINKKLCKHVTKKTNRTQIFFQDEIEKLFSAIDEELAENENCGSCLAIKFLFQTALRISELSSIMLSDLDLEEGTLHICRMEAKQADFNTNDCTFSKTRYEIENTTKNNNECGDRIIPLTDDALEIIKQAKEINSRLNFHTYLFNDETGRVTTRKVTYRLRKLCMKANIPNKTTHMIRRTTASILATQNVPLDYIVNGKPCVP